jgi:hypothetical protein
MKMVVGTILVLFSASAWAVLPMPDLQNGGTAIVGKAYGFATAYGDAHLKDCPDGGCVYIFRGKLPSSKAGAPVNTKTGGLMCSTCQTGIYLVDDYHFVFVYGPN